jgi:hypothetical protein
MRPNVIDPTAVKIIMAGIVATAHLTIKTTIDEKDILTSVTTTSWISLDAIDLSSLKFIDLNYPLTLSLSFPEHLNVTTLLGLSIMVSPVDGFLPLRSIFSLTQNLPNPEIITYSRDSSVLLMISKRVSTISEDLFLGKPV